MGRSLRPGRRRFRRRLRYGPYLASRGHTPIGVDKSPEMVDLARDEVPEGEFYEAGLHDVPLADDSVGLLVCAIALSHVADLAQALGEFVVSADRTGTWSSPTRAA